MFISSVGNIIIFIVAKYYLKIIPSQSPPSATDRLNCELAIDWKTYEYYNELTWLQDIFIQRVSYQHTPSFNIN